MQKYIINHTWWPTETKQEQMKIVVVAFTQKQLSGLTASFYKMYAQKDKNCPHMGSTDSILLPLL